jgi:hypothetical protein
VATTLVEGGVDTTDGGFGALNFDEVDGFHQLGLSSQAGSVEDTSGGRDDLTATSVDGISVKLDVDDVETNASHVLLAENTLLGGPLERSDHGILDFVEVLNSLGDIEHDVGAVGFGTESPDLPGIGLINVVLLGQDLGTLLGVVSGIDFTLFNGFGETLGEGLGSDPQSVVLVG